MTWSLNGTWKRQGLPYLPLACSGPLAEGDSRTDARVLQGIMPKHTPWLPGGMSSAFWEISTEVAQKP